MKQILGAIAAIGILSSTTAALADNAPDAGRDWSGFYIGLNTGAAHGRADAGTSTVFSPAGYFATSSVPAIGTAGDQTATGTGFTGGIQAGYNWQMDRLVLGLETGFDYLDLQGSTSSGAVYPCCSPTAFTINQSFETNWLFSLRPRVGWAMDNLLVYATGGLAVTEIKGNFTFSDTFASAAESASFAKTKAGWTLGGGLEYGIGDQWSLKAEYLHVDFGSVSTNSTNLTASAGAFAYPTNVFTHSMRLSEEIVRIGVSYKLY